MLKYYSQKLFVPLNILLVEFLEALNSPIGDAIHGHQDDIILLKDFDVLDEPPKQVYT